MAWPLDRGRLSRPLFARYVGVDYSGASTPDARIAGIEVFVATQEEAPVRALPEDGRRWSRALLAQWLEARLREREPTIVGMDFAFSLPARHVGERWDDFVRAFAAMWRTHERSVQEARDERGDLGGAHELRLCDRWTSSAKSPFLFDVQGSVAKSTFAGIPWLARLRETGAHFWPFDGFELAPGAHVVAETYPSILRRRYRSDLQDHQRDAWSIATWLRDRDARGLLARSFAPPLDEDERALARLEGWILGVG